MMNEAIVCQSSPVKILAVTAAPLRDLLNFLIYGRHPELLNERARSQPATTLEKIPATVKELKNILKAERCDKNGKFFFDCAASENHAAVLLHNQGAQFWIHYFRCGIGLVSLSFFSHLANAEGFLRIKPVVLRIRTNSNGSPIICRGDYSAAGFRKQRLDDWAIILSSV